MLAWEKYDDDTWGYEWGDLLALIKKAEGSYTCVVGTIAEAIYVVYDDELQNIQSRAMRALITLHNEADINRVKI